MDKVQPEWQQRTRKKKEKACQSVTTTCYSVLWRGKMRLRRCIHSNDGPAEQPFQVNSSTNIEKKKKPEEAPANND